MAEGYYVFRSKSRIKVLELSYVIMVDSSIYTSDSDQPAHTWLQVTESEVKSEEKGNFLILAIPIPSSLQLQFFFSFFIYTGTEGSLHFQLRLRFQCKSEPALSLLSDGQDQSNWRDFLFPEFVNQDKTLPLTLLYDIQFTTSPVSKPLPSTEST